jgi:dienelactone hydrolase
MVERFFIEKIPALLYAKDDGIASRSKGAVLMYHGSSASKDIHEKELSSIADAGLIAIGIDSVWHGERKNPELDKLFSHDNPEMLHNMLRAVNETALELPILTKFLHDEFGIPDRKIGILGISMGAFIVYKAISVCPGIRCAVAILGTPKHLPYHIQSYLKSFARTNLLSINASKDQYISSQETRHLHSILKARYKTYNERFLYKEYKRSGHFMLSQDWRNCWNAAIGFLCKNLY